MSYDIYLVDPVTKETLELDEPHFMRGGTYAIGGTRKLWLNVTYNYGSIYRKPDVLGESGIRSIYGLSGAESLPLLRKAVAALGDNLASDYWTPTEGNAKRALLQMIAMAKLRPDGIWDASLQQISGTHSDVLTHPQRRFRSSVESPKDRKRSC